MAVLINPVRACCVLFSAWWLLASCTPQPTKQVINSAADSLIADPQTLWTEVSKIRHSNPDLAAKLAVQSYQPSSKLSQEWQWRFRVRHAELLVDTDFNEAAKKELAVLRIHVPPTIPPKEAEARLASLEGYLVADDDAGKASELYAKAVSVMGEVKNDPCWSAELLVQHQAQALKDLKDFSGSELALTKAAGPARDCGDKAWLIMIPFIRGNSFNDRFLFESAVSSYRESWRLADADHNLRRMASATGHMALAYSNLGDSERAFEMFDKTDEYYESRKGKLTVDEWQMWESDIGHRARTYFLLRRFTEAEKTYKRAIQIATDTNDRDWLVLWLAELTSVYIETGDYQSADILNVQGLQKADFKKDSFRANRAFLNDARLKRLEGHFGEAETALEKLQNEPADEKDPKIIWELHVERAQLLADLNRVPQAREEFEAALRTGNNVRNSISLDDYRLTYFLPLRGIYESYVDFLVKHEQPEQALRISELGHARMLAEKLNMAGPQNSKLDFRKIAKAKNAVILSYSIAPKESYMWVTTGDSVTCLPMPADTSKKLETRISNHNEQIRYEQRSIEEDTGGNALYNTLIAPASSLIGSAKNIIVIPDGPLASLNFETLIPPGEKKHYWIESVRITVTPSFNLLRAERPQWAEPTSALLVGDAIPTARENLPPLGHDDLDYIQNLYPTKCDVLRKGQATPKEFLKAAKAKQYSWIYLSAHARSFSQSPLDSYIVLTPETAGGDYKLSARDLAKVGLKAELVTLSACQSAGAKNMPGEGLVGLSWTVLGDGARNVLASLWNVGVDQTTKLMEKFYRHMKAHESPSEALQAAKIEMIKENELPYSWAAFQLYSR